MNKEQLIENANRTIEYQRKLTAAGKDWEPSDVMEAERMLELVELPFTEEEQKRLDEVSKKVPFTNWNEVKDIKEKYGLSWNEIKLIARAMPFSTSIRIKDIRKRTGLSQAKFCEKYEIPKRTLENWEQGSRECPEYVYKLLDRVVGEDFD